MKQSYIYASPGLTLRNNRPTSAVSVVIVIANIECSEARLDKIVLGSVIIFQYVHVFTILLGPENKCYINQQSFRCYTKSDKVVPVGFHVFFSLY